MSETAAANINVKVNIKLPNIHAHHHGKKAAVAEKLALQFNKDTKVQTIIDVLGVAKQTKYLTNIQLRHNDAVLLDEQTLVELTSENAIEKDIPIDISVEALPYTTSAALRHAVTTRELIGFTSELEDGLSDFAVSGGSKFDAMGLSAIRPRKTEEEKKKEAEAAAEKDKNDKRTPEEKKKAEEKKKHFLDVTDEEKEATAKAVRELLKVDKDTSAKQFFATNGSLITPCVRSLNLSQYNPVPAFNRSQGHLLYLQIVTLEGESMHVTATPSGFYVNKSTNTKFDPSLRVAAENEYDNGKSRHGHKHGASADNVSSHETTFYSLYDLLAAHSKNFISHIEKLDAKLSTMENAAYVKPQTGYLCKPWIISAVPTNTGDYTKLQEAYVNNIVNPERVYNDEFQAVRDLPSESLVSRMEIERLTAKLIHEFSTVATAGAMDIFQGNTTAMDPDAPENDRIYLKDDIFYSFVSDALGNFSDNGGDEAARAASNQDLLTISVLNRMGLKDVRHLLTTIVDFGGKRLLAQTPVPGLLGSMGAEVVKDAATGKETLQDMESDIIVNYGFDENTNKVVHDQKFDDLLAKDFAKVFHLKKNNDKDVWFSSKSKGIVGSDKRSYVLDLANTYPIDINFAREHFDNVASEADRYPHRQTLVRPELVEKWWNSKVQAEKDLTADEAYNKDMFSYQCDAYQVDGVEDKTVDDISDYLNNEVITGVVDDFAAGNVTEPYSGDHLIDTLHKNGINARYLGKIIEIAQAKLDKEEKEHDEKLKEIETSNAEYDAWEVSYLNKIQAMIKERQDKINELYHAGKEIPKELKEDLKLDENEIRKPTKGEPMAVRRDELLPVISMAHIEIISRALKHIFRAYSKELPISVISSMAAYFLNLLFGSEYNASPVAETVDEFFESASYAFTSVTRDSLIEEIAKQAKLRFRIDLTADVIEKYLSFKLLMIKQICSKFGIQLINNTYFFNKAEFEDYKNAQDKKVRAKLVEPVSTFSKNDMIIIPVSKSSDYTSIISEEFWNQGTILLTEEKNNDALTLMAQAITILEEVKGVVHPEVAEKYLAMATVYSRMKLLPEAIAFCRKACIIYERTKGIDSFELIRALNNLALLELSNESPLNASIVYKRIIEQATLFQLNDAHHPIAASVLNNLEQVALGTNNLKLTTEVLQHLADLIVQLDGKNAVAYGFTESRLGNLFASSNEFQAALDHIVRAEAIFTKELGSNDHLTASAKQWINGLTNVLNEQRQQKILQGNQNDANSTPAVPHKKSNGKKAPAPKPELAEKSVDELLDFIEGDDGKKAKKGSKGKKNGKK